MSQLNSLDAFKFNTHTIYYGDNFHKAAVINLLTFAAKQFNDSYIIKNLNQFKTITDDVNNKKKLDWSLIMCFSENALIDAIKISICFENYLKAMHLNLGYIIHNIDKNIFKDLAKNQKDTPIRYDDFPVKFKDNRKINSSEELYRKCIVGLTQNTLNYSYYLDKDNYREINLLEDSFYEILRELNKTRNKLHLNNSISFDFTNQTYNQLKTLKDFIDNKIPILINNKKKFLLEKGLNPEPQFRAKRVNINKK